ncbi:NACHT domain-containing protein [Pseudomonas coronafaciens]|uniref:NACHT domain-containing protein n=1 Tax=Pseudomonas coronafaciens TaxID=53409 RepID=UPI0016055855|nr:NACHT domain-containing protein [Pseudomonas coronafaciens]
MVVESSTVVTLAKVLAPFMKSVYDGLATNGRAGFELWKSSSAVDMAANYNYRLSQVKTIWTRGKSIGIEEFYYPSKLVEDNIGKTVDSIADISAQCFIVEGVVGQGKSIFMRYLALSSFKVPELGLLPIFVELKNISEIATLKDLVLEELRSVGLEPTVQVLDLLLKKNKLILLLDGFDEIAVDLVSRTIREITGFRSKYTKLRIGISSRPDNSIQRVPGFVILPILPLEEDDYEPFLIRLEVTTVKRHSLLIAMQDSPAEIREVMSTPLMLSVVVIIYESYREIPSYLSEFFNALFHVVFTEHDRKKIAFDRKHHSGLSESELQHLFEAFCFTIMRNGYGRTLRLEQFNECFEKAQSFLGGKKCKVEDFKKDIVGVACLMLVEGVGLTTFLHKGILDYFSAAFVKRMDAATVFTFYVSSARNYLQWVHALGFLEKIDGYRHAKFFELGPIKEELVEVSALMMSKEIDGLIDYINNGRKGLIFSYRDDEGLTMTSPRDVSLRHELLDDFRYFIYFRCPQSTDEYLSFKGLDGSAVSVDVGNVQYSLNEAIQMAGVDEVWTAFGRLETDLYARVEAAEKLVLEHEERVELLRMELENP